MKHATPQKIAYNTAFTIAITLLVITTGLYFLIHKESNWIFVILISLSVFAISYFFFLYAIKAFIYKKIKHVYQNIYNLKSPDNSKDIDIDIKKDIIHEVNQEVMNLAEKKKDEIEKLKQTAKFRREFIGNVSHELKTPIFNIQGYIHTLIDGGINDPNINKEYLYKSAKSIDRLNSIIEDLEAISKLESGVMKLEMERFDIHNMVVDIFESLERLAEANDNELVVKEGYNIPSFVYADKGYIRQVLVNLISNSIKYGKENGHTSISFHDMGDHILTEVADDGIGIEEKYFPRLFERFFSVDKSRSREKGGTGLGLAIVKHIIEAHNQTIEVRSKIGVGTTFGFTLRKKP